MKIAGCRPQLTKLAAIFALAFISWNAAAANIEPPPDPGLEASTVASDVIAEVEIVAGGPFRAVAILKKALKGDAPKIFEIEGFNSFNWDTVHRGLSAGTRCILFLSKTERADVFATLTPAAPRINLSTDGAMVALGDPPVRIPVKPAALEEGLALLLERHASGKSPETAEKYLRGLWELNEIEARYLAVEMAGALREPRALSLVLEASKDKLLKLRLRAVEALGKIGTPEAFAALQGLLKDEKKSVSREAARALVFKRDSASLPALLEWVRKNSTATRTNSYTKPATGTGESEQAKVENLALEIVALARSGAHLADAEKIAQALLEITRMPGDKLAGEALEAAAAIAPATAVPTLIELTLDRTFEQRDRALSALQKIALKPVLNIEEFQAWWKDAGKKYTEDARRNAAESAARGLAATEELEDRRKFLELLRNAPGAIGVVSASPMLLKTKDSALFGEDDLALWNTPLAVPFLIERLGRESVSHRRSALEALINLSVKHPKLNAAIWPLLRAHLAERDSSARRAAELGAGQLARTDGINALIDALGSRSPSEQQEASKALYSMSARTFGFSLNEPVPDQINARAHLRGWWESEREKFKPLSVSIPLNPFEVFPRESSRMRAFDALTEAPRGTKLEALTLSEESVPSEAAFAVLWAERAPGDAFWKKMTSQGRLRDRARGILGSLGSHAAVKDLKKQFGAPTAVGGEAPALISAFSLLGLTAANLPAEGSIEGARTVTAWLKGPGEKASLPLKRLAVLCLGLADKEPESLALLDALADAALKADPPDIDATRPDEIESDYALMRSTLVALCARSDSSAILLKLLNESLEARIRETAARALSLRRDHAAVAGIAKALNHADRFTWVDITHSLEPLILSDDLPVLHGMLESEANTARAAAVLILSRRPELGNDPKTRAMLIAALGDISNLVRYYAAESLGKRRAKSSLETLIKTLDDTDDEVRAAAAAAIGEIGDRDACEAVVKALPLQYRPDARWMKALAIAGSDKNLGMILKFANSNMYMEQRAGMEALSASAMPAGVGRLMKAFRSEDEPLQTLAATLLVQRGDGLLPLIDEDLNSKDKAARARAYHLLSRVRTAKVQKLLKEAFKTEEDQNLKTLIGWALSRAAN